MKNRKNKSGGVIMDHFSILIPVYNEEEILEKSSREIISQLKDVKTDFELLVCENGSTDKTVEIAERLKREIKYFDFFRSKHANYGKALEKGIERAKYNKIVVFEIDYYDIDFLRKSIALLDEYDLIIGSKRAPGSVDERSSIRKFITWGFNTALKFLVGFKGTDTHGLKAMRKDKLLHIARSCKVFNNLFSTEFVIRAERAGLSIKELPAHVAELRDTRVGVLKRIPRAFINLIKLVWVLRFRSKKSKFN